MPQGRSVFRHTRKSHFSLAVHDRQVIEGSFLMVMDCMILSGRLNDHPVNRILERRSQRYHRTSLDFPVDHDDYTPTSSFVGRYDC